MIFILYYLLHMKMKKFLVGAFLWMFALAGVAVLPNYANAATGDWAEDPWVQPRANKNLLSKDQELTGSKFLDTVRNAINWILWILATIALVMCLYWWFKMVTSGWDEKKYGDGLKVLKYAGIGLAIIGLSWMIVSVIFWFVGSLWESTEWDTVDGNSTDWSIVEVE